MTAIIAVLASIAAVVATRVWDRAKIERVTRENARLKADNSAMLFRVASLERDLREARRAPISHDDAVRILQNHATRDGNGRP